MLESMKPVENETEKQIDYDALIDDLTEKMMAAAEELDFEEAARIRDKIRKLEKERNA